jgi:hypothetical protein
MHAHQTSQQMKRMKTPNSLSLFLIRNQSPNQNQNLRDTQKALR